MKKFLGKHRKAVIIIVILLVLVLGVASCINSAKKAGEAMLASMMQTETAQVERRTLVRSLSATGKVTSQESETVTAAVSGVEVLAVKVEVGDMVTAGDVICILDDTDLQKSLKDAKQSLYVTQENTNMNVSSAQENLDSAKEAREEALAEIDEQILIANEGRLIWEESLSKATSEAEIANCKANIERITKTYDSYVEQREDLLKTYDSNVEKSEDSLKSTQLNASISDISGKNQVSMYEDQIAACTVTAPISGVVTAVNVKEGGTYAGAAIATVEDISAFEVTAEIDEYDISKIKVGQKVVMKTNGTGDAELNGTVVHVAPRATAGTGNVTYKVTMSIETACEDLRMDMTAKLSIILESKENVITVPYDAVQEDEEGNFYVELARETAGEETKNTEVPTEKIYVTKGIESDYYIEVSGLEEGMTVIVPTADGGLTLQDLLSGRGAMGGM